ncbi:IS21-like element helper ATPase IstB [Hydrocarboniphaga effusa]|jgi:DNA replication protein DnaC|uniref:IS21-like element helper ATPase IstB n=1 Tax=Hydrocarboniphaga effusa TaxID=243629 RepID=UPI003BAAA750
MTIATTLDALISLRLRGMHEALQHQLTQASYINLSFEQRLQMLVDGERSHRDSRRFSRLLRNAKLKQNAQPEDVVYGSGRGFERAAFSELLTCAWIYQNLNVLMTGATGTGKTWLACALAVEAARRGITILYKRVGRMLEEMSYAHEDGSILKMRSQLAKVQLLILDDFGLSALDARAKSDLLELLDDRVGSGATIVLGQMPVREWHNFINDPAVADAILDRLIHSSVKIELQGDSMRRMRRRPDQVTLDI